MFHLSIQFLKKKQNDLWDLLKFIRETKRIKLNFYTFKITPEIISSEEYELNTRHISLVIKSIITPLKFELNNIKLTGSLKGIVKFKNSEWAVISVESLNWENISMQYDSDNDIFQGKECHFLRKLSQDEKQVFMIVKIQDIKQISLEVLWNIRILSRSNLNKNTKVILYCKGHLLSNLVHVLKSVPKNTKIELVDYSKIYPWVFEYIHKEFWTIIIGFKNIWFKCEENKIRFVEIIGEFDGENLSNNNFKVSIRGINKIVSYDTLFMMINEYI